MMNVGSVLIVAPHADDETLGCGGTICRLIDMGFEVHWLVVTSMQEPDFNEAQILKRESEIKEVSKLYNFKSTILLDYKAATLNSYAQRILINDFYKILNTLKPATLFVPFRDDAHSDHRIVFDSIIAASKSFRHPYIKNILAYETLSETEFNLKPGAMKFSPNFFVDITKYLEKKILTLQKFESEISIFPFPRSSRSVKSLADLRGVQINCEAAEAFMLLKGVL